MKKPKKRMVTYKLEICYNKETDEIEYIAEGYENDSSDSFSPSNIDKNMVSDISVEDMEELQDNFNIVDN